MAREGAVKRYLGPLGLLLFAVIFTWPAAIGGATWMVGRHVDLPGTIWFIDAAPRLWGGVDPLTAFPEGARYGRPDSWVLLVLGTLAQALSPVRVHNLLQVLGVWISGLAAERFAREIGARSPWSWIAGISFAFSGLAATSLLEGHVYHLVNPWLPILALAWWRSTRRHGRARDGALAGLAWALCLASSAYQGLAATLLVVGFGVGGLLARELRVRPLAAAAGVAMPVGGLYVSRFGAPLRTLPDYLLEGFPSRMLYLEHGSANALSLAAPTPALDQFEGSLSLHTPAVVLALCLVAPVALARLPGWRRLAGTALFSLLMAFGPALFDRNGPVLVLPLGWFVELPALELLRFPARLGWVFALCGGALAARVGTALAERVGRAAWPLGGLLILDVLGWGGMPMRQRMSLAQVPSAYAGEGAVLDLYPESLGRSGRLRLLTQSLGCYYQTGHHRPIADDCVTPFATLNPRLDVQRAVTVGLLNEVDAAGALRAGGFAAVAFHPDLFPQPLRARLEAGLRQLDPEPVVSLDGGEHVQVYALQ